MTDGQRLEVQDAEAAMVYAIAEAVQQLARLHTAVQLAKQETDLLDVPTPETLRVIVDERSGTLGIGEALTDGRVRLIGSYNLAAVRTRVLQGQTGGSTPPMTSH